MKTVVVVPVYNERATALDVLERLLALGKAIEGVVIVDDGSTDGTSALLADWVKGKERVVLLRHPRNRGYSEGLLTGFRYVIGEAEQGKLSLSDAVVTVDADGQHDPAELPGFINVMEQQDVDVVWARRDFSLYPLWKRAGNSLMSLMASAVAGVRFKDVESGYCVFRIGPLKDALRFQKSDSRYSLSLTLAIALAQLGYRISNEPIASIKLYRSRTRVLDVALDTWAALTAWARVSLARVREHPWLATRFSLALAILAAFLVAVGLVATKSIYLGHDSINNYAHVWYISDRLFHGSLPLHFHNLELGEALTYPYGFVSWTMAALLRPALGDYAVTLTMVVGVLLTLVVVYLTRLKSNLWLLALFIIIPFFPEVLLNFQMPFAWGLLFGYLYAWALDRRSYRWAMLWLLLSAGNHLVIMGPILVAYSAYVYVREPAHRKALQRISVLAAVPLGLLAWYSLQTPATGENSAGSIAGIYTTTMLERVAVFVAPFVLLWLYESRRWWLRPLAGQVAACGALAGAVLWNTSYSGYSGLTATVHNEYETFLSSPAYVKGPVYRVLAPPKGEQGQYFFIQRGAVLASEFFAESQFRRDWTEASYRCFLGVKQIDFVVMSDAYTKQQRTNEADLLQQLQQTGLTRTVYQDPLQRFSVFDVKLTRDEGTATDVRGCLRLEATP